MSSARRRRRLSTAAQMIDDISLDGEFFDSDFFVYREDADVAWRAQLMGWSACTRPTLAAITCAMCCRATGAPAAGINMHSVKNRFLMRMKNITPDLYRRNWVSITARDLVVLGCCLVGSIHPLKAFWYVARNWRRVLEKRARS